MMFHRNLLLPLLWLKVNPESMKQEAIVVITSVYEKKFKLYELLKRVVKEKVKLSP
jgi:hypothetical protein